VTSLGRTWPSTIFWRALEKPDIGRPQREAEVAAGWNENRAIFDTRLAKTQHDDGASRSLRSTLLFVT
jgi:hypothetical protein